ncbi:MAG TPA: redoxin family protein [Tepidisphaeraceae bacterium]|nr:redoxin family protein [Tepidisphaeraceae bacterium]
MHIRKSIALFLVISLTHALSAAAVTPEKFEPQTLPINSPAPDFSLPATDGKTYSLADFAVAKILVIIFTSNHCPTAQAYESRIQQIATDYKDKGVALVAINPNDPTALRLDELGYTDLSDDLASMKLRAADHHFTFPYLYDGDTQSTAKAYGCQATPHVFIFDQSRHLRYTGHIDDSDVHTPKHNDARNAIDALLAGVPVPVEKTHVFGCSTKWSFKRDEVAKYIETVNAEPVTLSTIDLPTLQTLAKNDSKKLRLINFWATWCGPCTAELPEFVTINRMYRKRPFEMITVSLDEPDKKNDAESTLKDLHVSSANYLFTGDRDAMMKSIDPAWEGPIPHTLLIAPGGKILYHHTGEIDPLELKRAIVNYLGRTY